MVPQTRELNRSAEGFEAQLGGNHFGTFLLVSLLLPRLRQAGPGARVVAVSSISHTVSPFRWDDPNYQLRPEEYGEIELCRGPVLFPNTDVFPFLVFRE